MNSLFWFFCWISFAAALRPPSDLPFDKMSTTTTSSNKSALKPLTLPTVQQAIRDSTATGKELTRWLQEKKNLRLQLVADWRATLNSYGQSSSSNSVNATTLMEDKTPWYFGMSLTDATTNEAVGIFTFYVAYSSWNGRILYVDRLDCQGDEQVERMLLKILAQIAVDLDCARITWRHTSTPAWHAEGNNRPEMHGDVLTLSMDQTAMTNFLSDSPLSAVEPIDGCAFGKDLVEAAFQQCLDKINSQGSPFRLRLAKIQDLDTMTRLVQGLADYCEESDAVHMKADDYVQDGFDLEDPLWYCLLVDKLDDDKDGAAYHTCGYAFVFVGHIMGQGRFIYLEDLYLEVEHRGGGGGSTVMKTLASLCRAMKCSRLYWQALDWNAGGLAFYEKIGAKIHPGEKTSRYATESLKQFAKHR